MKKKVSIFWFRRDLRLQDNCGLYHALSSNHEVLPIFIFDKDILDDLSDKEDARLSFIHQELNKLNQELKEKKNSGLVCKYGKVDDVWEELVNQFEIQAVFTNHDYEPYAIKRDERVCQFLKEKEIAFHSFKDQVIFEKDEIVKDNGEPYLVYTPYSKKWLSMLSEKHLESYTSGLMFDNWHQYSVENIPTLSSMGFKKSDASFPSLSVSNNTLLSYEDERDSPPKDSTSRVGIHLRFGTISIRKLASQAKGKSMVFLKELIWREFFMMILYHYPKVVDHNFNSKYDRVEWRNNEDDFKKWCNGETGYLLVDAGMRELNQTGFMHNRVRMLVASFLTKHLLIDWKWGEAYFAQKLLDYELASNNGNWQWAAGTGVDAAPYFRIFNPITQVDKFDKQHIYIKRWVNDYKSESYPEKMVEHKAARERALHIFKKAINKS
tara:strand:- start:323 stop:1633 length:1311 start_codon:yes stop_codon:yes gene_type:complete